MGHMRLVFHDISVVVELSILLHMVIPYLIINLNPRHHHITPVLQQLNWLTISRRCQLKILMLTFNVLHRKAPPYMCEIFHWYTPARPLRSASTTSLIPKRNNTVLYGRRMMQPYGAHCLITSFVQEMCYTLKDLLNYICLVLNVTFLSNTFCALLT